MGARGESLREGVFGFVFIDKAFQLGSRLHTFLGKFIGERDGLTVLINAHQYGHIFFRPTDAQVHTINEAVQNMGGVQFTVD